MSKVSHPDAEDETFVSLARLRGSRRSFLQGISTGVASVTIGGCGRPPDERIMPYNRVPPELTPGIPQRYATALTEDGYAMGVIVQAREGRPIKIEGNPAHPASLGATSARDQARIYDLYDPRRTRGVTEDGLPREWTELAQAVARRSAGDQGARLRFLLEPTTSPLTIATLERIREVFPAAKLTFYSPADPSPERRPAVHYDFEAAERVLLLDSDVLGQGPFHVRYSRAFADRRRVRERRGSMHRVYAVGPRPNVTTSLADRVHACLGREVGAVAAAILHEVWRRLPEHRSDAAPMHVPVSMSIRRFAAEVAADLVQHVGASVVVAGEHQPPAVHAIATALNDALEAVGRTTWWTRSPRYDAGSAGLDLSGLVEEMRAGAVDTLVIAGVDAVYCTPSELRFADALANVPFSVAWSLFRDRTAQACRWVVPAAHELEGWGDARAYDGVLSLRQPLLEPLWGGRTLDELLGLWARRPLTTDFELVRQHYARAWGSGWEARFEQALARGIVPDTAFPREPAAPEIVPLDRALREVTEVRAVEGLEVGLHLDPKVYDGRYATNAWLEELPHPITKLTWGNAAMVGPRTAEAHGWSPEAVVAIRVGDEAVHAPILIVPGHVEGAVSLALGYGRTDLTYRHFANPGLGTPSVESIGFDAYRLRSASEPWYRAGARVEGLGESAPLAITQGHQDQHERELAYVMTLHELHERGSEPLSHLRGQAKHLGLVEQERASPQWGMAIDMNVCHGCSACVIACQAENNIPTVGRDEVRRGREMHWLRIDRYTEGPSAELRVVNQPMACQHCEYAPCEYVCPVNATVHSPDGLNEMVYNRCIGTRFCSNNCPYKVRRFNWFEYEADAMVELSLQKNPEVTVRERGVMEKCTYCVQRIRRTEIQADLEDRPLARDEVVTACQQACPTRAIVFGDISDPQSEVSTWRERPQRYSVLHELGAEPRTVYLAKLRNLGPGEG